MSNTSLFKRSIPQQEIKLTADRGKAFKFKQDCGCGMPPSFSKFESKLAERTKYDIKKKMTSLGNKNTLKTPSEVFGEALTCSEPPPINIELLLADMLWDIVEDQVAFFNGIIRIYDKLIQQFPFADFSCFLNIASETISGYTTRIVLPILFLIFLIVFIAITAALIAGVIKLPVYLFALIGLLILLVLFYAVMTYLFNSFGSFEKSRIQTCLNNSIEKFSNDLSCVVTAALWAYTCNNYCCSICPGGGLCTTECLDTPPDCSCPPVLTMEEFKNAEQKEQSILDLSDHKKEISQNINRDLLDHEISQNRVLDLFDSRIMENVDTTTASTLNYL